MLEGVAARLAAAPPPVTRESFAGASPVAEDSPVGACPATSPSAAFSTDAAYLQEWFTLFEADALVGVLIDAARKLCTAGDPEALLAEWEAGPGQDIESCCSMLEPAEVTLQHRALEAVRESLVASAADGARTDAEREVIHDSIRRLDGPASGPAGVGSTRTAPQRRGAAVDKARFEGVREPASSFTKLDQSPWKEFKKPDELADAELFRLLKAMVPVLREHLRAFGRPSGRCSRRAWTSRTCCWE